MTCEAVLTISKDELQTFPRREISEFDAEEAFRSTFYLAPIGMAHVGLDGSWLRVNPALCAMTGYSEAELKTRRFQDITHPDDLEIDNRYIARLLNGAPAAYSIEKRYLHPDGGYFWVNVAATVKRNAEGKPEYFIACVQDVSSRVEAEHHRNQLEKEVIASSEYLKNLIDSIPHMVWVADSSGQVLKTNRRFFEYTGLSVDAVAGEGWEHVVHPDDLERVSETWRKAHTTKDHYFCESRLRSWNGEYRWFLGRGVPYCNSQGELFWFGTNSDIHDHKMQNEELKQSNAELARFAYIASHDLKEPLRTVANYSQLLAKHHAGSMDEMTETCIKYTTLGVRRMYQLIDDLLSFSRFGTTKPEMQSMEAIEVVTIALENLSEAIRETEAQITVGALPRIHGDQQQLVQLFQNLISNAIKYRSSSTPRVQIGASEQSNEWIFHIRDNGIGMEKQYLEKIFILFQRLHSKDVYPGTGIGLAVCKKVVERHGGIVWVDSQPNVGSTFYFTLPKELKNR